MFLQYIALLRKAPSLRRRLRSAHEALASGFPLGEDLWLEWINDELETFSHHSTAAAAAAEGHEGGDGAAPGRALKRLAACTAYILELLARSTQDYLSPSLWAMRLE